MSVVLTHIKHYYWAYLFLSFLDFVGNKARVKLYISNEMFEPRKGQKSGGGDEFTLAWAAESRSPQQRVPMAPRDAPLSNIHL